MICGYEPEVLICDEWLSHWTFSLVKQCCVLPFALLEGVCIRQDVCRLCTLKKSHCTKGARGYFVVCEKKCLLLIVAVPSAKLHGLTAIFQQLLFARSDLLVRKIIINQKPVDDCFGSGIHSSKIPGCIVGRSREKNGRQRDVRSLSVLRQVKRAGVSVVLLAVAE